MNQSGTIQLNFFNTIHLTGAELKAMIEQCNRQEGRILEIMSDGKQRTPFEILEIYNSKYPPIPITSCRRAITCLSEKTGKGFLVKCSKMKMGAFGKPNFVWTIKRVA